MDGLGQKNGTKRRNTVGRKRKGKGDLCIMFTVTVGVRVLP